MFDAYDMDLKCLLRLRQECPEEFPDGMRTSICKHVFLGLAYLHDRCIMHRDIKPANIFVRFGLLVNAVLGDVGLGSITSSPAADDVHTAHVCSDGYVAPELLAARRDRTGSAMYGRPVDIWSAGVVLFEVATLDPFLEPGHMTLGGIARRIGSPPADYGPVPAVVTNGLETSLCEHWLVLGLMCLEWLPKNRATAPQLANHPAWDTWTVVAGATPVRDDLFTASPPSAKASSAAAVSASVCDYVCPLSQMSFTSEHYPELTARPVELGSVHAIPDDSPSICEITCHCSGNCGISGHSRHKCKAVATQGSKYCTQCVCPWLNCNSPKGWSGYCHRHGKTVTGLTPIWKTVRAAKELNQSIVPCDVLSFNGFFERYRDDLAYLVVAAFVKEPGALQQFECLLRRGTDSDEASAFREGWVNVINSIAGGAEQRTVELRQLTKSGTGRVSGLGPTLASVGILEPSPAAGPGKKIRKPDVYLGLTKRGYYIRHDEGMFNQFWEDFNADPGDYGSWADALEVPKFGVFLYRARRLLQFIAKKNCGLGLKKEGYCFHFLYRKLLIAEAQFRNKHASFAAVDWSTITLNDLTYMSADANEHLLVFDCDVNASALSYFFFGRTDWALFLSCFACLWGEVHESDTDVDDVVKSEALLEYAAAWRKKNGIAPHPSVLLHDFRESLGEDASGRRTKKRRVCAINISDDVTPRQPRRGAKKG